LLFSIDTNEGIILDSFNSGNDLLSIGGAPNRIAVSVPRVKSENLLVKLSKVTTADAIEESNGLFISTCMLGWPRCD